jgi:hypothetical protein
MLSSLGTGWRLHREIAFEAFHGSGEGGSKLSGMDEVLRDENSAKLNLPWSPLALRRSGILEHVA